MPRRLKKKRPAMPGAGRPARAGGAAASTFSLRLTAEERALLQALAASLGVTEGEVLRRALAAFAAQAGP